MNLVSITLSLALVVSRVWASALEIPSVKSRSRVEVLPVEVCDEIFKGFDVKDYADYLNVSTTRFGRASGRFEDALLETSAAELNALKLDVWRDRERIKRILSGVQTLVRLRFGLSLGEHESEIPEDAVQALQENFKILASLSNNRLWRLTILMSLAGHVPWNILLHRLSDNFVTDNLEAVLGTIAATGDFLLLDHTIRAYHLPRTTQLLHTLAPAIVLTGSIQFFTAVYESLPSQDDTLSLYKKYSLMLNRHELFKALWAKELPLYSGNLQGAIEDAFYAICLHGDVDIWQKVVRANPTLHERSKGLECLRYASKSGNMPIIRNLLWNHKAQCQRTDLSLASEEWCRLVTEASRHNQVEMLRFFLLELDDYPLDELWPVLLNVARDALIAGRLEIFKLIFGRNRHGAYFVPEFRFDCITNDILRGFASKGQLEMLQYLVETKASMSNADPRWDSLVLDQAGNIMLQEAFSKGHLKMVQFLLQRDEKSGQYLFPGIDPAADNNACLAQACDSGNLEAVKELFREDEHGHRMHPTVQLGVSNTRSLIRAVSSLYLDIVEFLLHRVRKEDGTIHYTIPGAADCIRDPALIHAAIYACQWHHGSLKLLLQLDADGSPYHPDLTLPGKSLRYMVSQGWSDLLELSLRHRVEDRQEEIRLALAMALEKRSLRSTYLLVNALHGPLPALDEAEGVDRLASIILAQGYMSRTQLYHNLLCLPILAPWEGKLTRIWLMRQLRL